MQMVRKQLIKEYFNKDFTYKEIQQLLKIKHNINISISTIQRTISSLGLRRKNIKESDLHQIVTAAIEEIHSCGYNLGYRALWQKLKIEYKINVKRETIYKILKLADAEGITDRFGNRLKRRMYKNPGPNYVWHLDGYDKLKPFGFAIHGCIDGFSRKVLWLEVGTSNNDPKITARYFLNTVKKYGFLSTIIRCDRGSENTLIGSLQRNLRKNHDDSFAGDKSFVQGRSVHNQRIEAYWGQMRRHSVDFYINFFKSMREKNIFNGSRLHTKCLQYCFGPLIRYDLHATQNLWNLHRIRKQSKGNVCGKPYLLFNAPQKYNCKDYKRDVNLDIISKLIENLTKECQLFDPRILELAKTLLPNFNVPSTVNEALLLYNELLKTIEN